MQTLDYKKIPFRCRSCHDYGHIYRDCPQNSPPPQPKHNKDVDEQGFSRVRPKKRVVQRKEVLEPSKRLSTTNKFAILEEHVEKEETPELFEA